MKGLVLSLVLHALFLVSFIRSESQNIGFKNNNNTSSISVNIYRKKTNAQIKSQKSSIPKEKSESVATGVKEKIVLTNLAPPTYPEESRLYGEEGVVTVDLDINDQGRVTAISLAHSSGFERLDQAVIAQMKESRFEDYKGEKLELSFKFELTN